MLFKRAACTGWVLALFVCMAVPSGFLYNSNKERTAATPVGVQDIAAVPFSARGDSSGEFTTLKLSPFDTFGKKLGIVAFFSLSCTAAAEYVPYFLFGRCVMRCGDGFQSCIKRRAP